jgi:hypothetical protein
MNYKLQADSDGNLATAPIGASATPWTDRAIDYLKAEAFTVHPTVWNELRRIEREHAAMKDALQKMRISIEDVLPSSTMEY